MVKIKDLISRSFDLVKISSKNKLILKDKTDNEKIKVDEEQLNRVFINLIKNSEESLTEKAQKVANFNGKIEIEITNNNHYIVIKISDNGIGIPDIKKAMNPYFTTKPKGTGLGLPIINKIINEHSGELVITNNEGMDGVKIEISLPRNNE